MTITATGTIERRNIGLGAWAFVTEDGVTYEISKSADKNLLKLKKEEIEEAYIIDRKQLYVKHLEQHVT